MSRSNPQATSSPVQRYFKIRGQTGSVAWYDKVGQQEMEAPLPFRFLLLDELATVTGWHEPTESGIYSNEVRDTRSEPFLVRTFSGLSLASGLYAESREKLAVAGAKYAASCYIAYKNGAGLELGNIQFKGSALTSWSNFKRECSTAGGVKTYYTKSVVITDFESAKKGATTFHVPNFALADIPPALNDVANALDAQLQLYLAAKLAARAAEIDSEPSPESVPY